MQPLRIAGDFDAEYNWLDPALNHSRLQQSLFIEILAQQLLVTWTQLFPFKLVLARTELLEQLSLVEVALLQLWLVALLHVFIQIPEPLSEQLVAALELVPPIA